MSFINMIQSARTSAVAAVLILALGLAAFVVIEPVVSRSATDIFLITQSITSEISFIASTTDVTMAPAIAGITGGIANGTTTVRIETNNTTGYNMTLSFDNAVAMQGNTQGGEIVNYTPASTTCNGVGGNCVPDYNWTVGANTGEFGYSVTASTSADVDQTFLSNGSNACNVGSTNTQGTCWLNPSTTAERIINTAAETFASGATTSIAFKVELTSSPSPAIPEDTYTATATLTAVTN